MKTIEFFPYKLRIGNLEVSNYYEDRYGKKIPHQIHLNAGYTHFEILKWDNNHYYGKLEEYIKDGWEQDGGFLRKNGVNIDINFFLKKETCYTIASFVNIETSPTLEFVGIRPCDLDEDETLTFMELVREGWDEIHLQTSDEEDFNDEQDDSPF
jgi:hypothetical protein